MTTDDELNELERYACSGLHVIEGSPMHHRSKVMLELIQAYRTTVRDLDAIRVEFLEAQHAVGEAWFAGGASLAEAIKRKTERLEAAIDPKSYARMLRPDQEPR